ncbi:MAG: hypothetical protein V4557_03845 [Bacteroidota bacterium]
MKNKTDILQELREISPLIVDFQSVNPYGIPGGYFTAFPEMMLEKIRIEAMLANASANTYGVPAGYFEGLSANILSKIKTGETNNEVQIELAELAPLLNTISKELVYTVPAGYFEAIDLTATMQAPKEAKVVTLRIARKWMQFAAAAVMAGILVTGAFLFTDDRGNLNNTNIDVPDVSSEMNKVSEDDLIIYLDNPEHFVAAPAATSLASEAELADVKNNLQRVSDEELNQYLKENAEPFDASVSEKE